MVQANNLLMKKIYIVIIACFVSYLSPGQDNFPMTYSSLFPTTAAHQNPAQLGQDFKKVHVNLFNLYNWGGNTTFSIGDLQNIGDPSKAEELVNTVRDENRIGIGGTNDILNVGVNIKDIFSVSFGVSQRYGVSFNYPGSLFRLAWQGNEPYAGEKVDMDFAINAFAAMEYHIGGAIDIPELIPDLKLRAGVRLKYINGLAGVQTERANLGIYTEPDGKYIDLSYDYKVNYAYDEEITNGNTGRAFAGSAGTGFATDIGISAEWKENFFGSINILDLGGINFNNYDTTVSNSGSTRWEGAEVENIFKDPVEFNTEVFEEATEDAEHRSAGGFTRAYPTRLRSTVGYRIPEETVEGNEYNKHSFMLTYIQGFRDMAPATVRAYIGGGYVYNLKSKFEVGTNVGFRGYNRIMEMGAFVAVRAGFFRFAIGSGNITPLVRSFGTGIDLNTNMTFAF